MPVKNTPHKINEYSLTLTLLTVSVVIVALLVTRTFLLWLLVYVMLMSNYCVHLQLTRAEHTVCMGGGGGQVHAHAQYRSGPRRILLSMY